VLLNYEKKDKIVHLERMWSALACDVITEYTFGFNYNQLGSEDFAETFHRVFLEAGLICNFIPHFPWIGKVCTSPPAT
jgi:hypothetical protein